MNERRALPLLLIPFPNSPPLTGRFYKVREQNVITGAYHILLHPAASDLLSVAAAAEEVNHATSTSNSSAHCPAVDQWRSSELVYSPTTAAAVIAPDAIEGSSHCDGSTSTTEESELESRAQGGSSCSFAAGRSGVVPPLQHS